jgi:hypothetical protein
MQGVSTQGRGSARIPANIKVLSPVDTQRMTSSGRYRQSINFRVSAAIEPGTGVDVSPGENWNELAVFPAVLNRFSGTAETSSPKCSSVSTGKKPSVGHLQCRDPERHGCGRPAYPQPTWWRCLLFLYTVGEELVAPVS